MEVTLASGVSGVVTRDAKGSGQGTITITDGNNLDTPADVRFPKARGEGDVLCSALGARPGCVYLYGKC